MRERLLKVVARLAQPAEIQLGVATGSMSQDHCVDIAGSSANLERAFAVLHNLVEFGMCQMIVCQAVMHAQQFLGPAENHAQLVGALERRTHLRVATATLFPKRLPKRQLEREFSLLRRRRNRQVGKLTEPLA